MQADGKRDSEFATFEVESADMKASKTLSATPNEKFTKALASVLSASPKQIQDSRAQAKDEKPSPHTKYSYAPEEGHS